MRRERRHGARAVLAAVVLLIGLARPARADIVYLYDDTGRLVRVIREDGEVASYHYNVVSNTLQITRESGLPQTTTVTATSQSAGGQGTTVPLTLSGANLIGASVVCTTAGLTVENVHTDFDQITLELVIDQAAPTGPVQCEIRGATVATLPFSIIRTIPAYLGAPDLSVRIAEALQPFVTTAVGVQVAAPVLAVDRSVLGAASVQIGPGVTQIAAAAVTLSLTPVVTSVSPAAGAPGTPSLALRILGVGLGDVTDVRFLRNNAVDTDITVVTSSVTPDGTEVDLEIAIAAGAAAGARVVQITTPAGSSTADGTGGNLFTVQ